MIAVRVEARVLEVSLPPTLLILNRLRLVEAVAAALAPGITRVRLDAAALRQIDTAGLGALARIVRASMDATSRPPELMNVRAEILESMRAVRLLYHFDLVAPAKPRGWTRQRHPGLTAPGKP